MSNRTISLTNRTPVAITDGDWPMIASASDKDYEGQVECQSFRRSKWFVGVRQHEDGRAIVYATYRYSTAWQDERSLYAKRGVLLPVGTDADAICAAIRDVCGDIAAAEASGSDADRWTELSAECQADMPAECLD